MAYGVSVDFIIAAIGLDVAVAFSIVLHKLLRAFDAAGAHSYYRVCYVVHATAEQDISVLMSLHVIAVQCIPLRIK